MKIVVRINKIYPLQFVLLFFLFSAPAFACYESSVISPSPFMGNHDEIFKLSDGSIWQVKYEYEYEYLYEYYPDVVICPSNNVLIVDSKKLNVINLSNSGSSTGARIIESRIDGTFNGWGGNTIVKLVSGQIWQQSKYHYSYHYAYRPEVLIYRQSSGFMMQVEGMNKPVRVIQIK